MVKASGEDGRDGDLEDRKAVFDDVVLRIFAKAGMAGCGSFSSENGRFMLDTVKGELKKAGYPEVRGEDAQRIADMLLKFKGGMERTVNARRAGIRGAVRQALGRFWEKEGGKPADAEEDYSDTSEVSED